MYIVGSAQRQAITHFTFAFAHIQPRWLWLLEHLQYYACLVMFGFGSMSIRIGDWIPSWSCLPYGEALVTLDLISEHIYSETCVIRPPLLPAKSGLIRQVVFPDRQSLTQVSLYMDLVYVVLIILNTCILYTCKYMYWIIEVSFSWKNLLYMKCGLPSFIGILGTFVNITIYKI